MFKKLLYIIVTLTILSCLGAGGALYYLIVLEPGDEISLENIRHILGRESPVYYNDGVSPLGVFFADAHRQYIEYQDIPKSFVNALVAAEDNRFFSHFGFDVVGITRAAIKNIQARRIVQGGSTLTQQTAKNLFRRKDRSIKEKLKELLFALRLEYHYSKEQIFEFYANQFYVSGNGLGLGVAARYYFDKTPDQLSLLESAYIAGSVKRPNYYNPFIKRNSDAADQARERGKVRVAYVLKNMKELGMISETELQQALTADVDFNKGAVGYSLDYVMELVTDAVASDTIVDALAAHDIDNIATSGIRIITSVDKALQSKTLYALRKQLSLLDVRLRGYERDEVQEELQQTNYEGDTTITPGSCLFGDIQTIKREGKNLEIEVFLGPKIGSGIVDRSGVMHLVDARVKWQEHRWSEPKDSDYDEFLSQLQEGDRVWVSVREQLPDGRLLLDLEKFPLVKGGAIVTQHGRMIAVAGGVENRFFNRAVYGKRTMGSSYKPFLYAAALQLGWNSADLLSNKRDVFVFQDNAYFPRPDHAIDSELVSMSWAGVRSENLASVWLTKHLCDHLGRLRFQEVASRLDLAPRVVDGEQEPYRLFRSRIRDRYGIIINQDMLRKAAYRKTMQHIQPDLVFEGLEGEYESLKELHYGLGFKHFLAELDIQLEGVKPLTESERSELQLRKTILAKSFLSISELRVDLQRFIDQKVDPFVWINPDLTLDTSEKPGLYYDRIANVYYFDLPSNLAGPMERIDQARFQQYLEQLTDEAREQFVADIKLGNALSVGAFDFVEGQVDAEFQRMKKQLPYSFEVLEHVDDFRTLVGLHYLVAFGKAMGIESELEPVLSFPLGSNVVTLLETTRLYEALATGNIALFKEKNGQINNTLAIIDRIESEDGVVLFRPEPQIKRVVAPKTTLAVGHILENTVKFGTGRYADQHVKLNSDIKGSGIEEISVSVPLLGKTGTANRYTNASFFGFLPSLNSLGNGAVIPGGYAVGVYVGYDDNKVMRQKTTRITGSAGALPAWTDIVNAILQERGYSSNLDPVDLSFYGLVLHWPDMGQVNLAAVPDKGGSLDYPLRRIDPLNRYQPSIMTFGSTETADLFKPARDYAPFWQEGDTDEPDASFLTNNS